MPYTFGKEERLCSRSLIDRLYAEGHKLMAFPFSVQWMATDGPKPCLVMIVAPKRKFRHAVDRNAREVAQRGAVVVGALEREAQRAPRPQHVRAAVDRNRVRRLTRECWRLRKPELYTFLQERNLSIALSLVYIHNEIMSYGQLCHKADKLVALLEQDIQKSLEP